MEEVLRKCFLFLSSNEKATKIAKKHGLKLGAGKFVAGTTIESVVKAVQALNQKGCLATVDSLGEFVSNETEAREATEHCLRTLEAIHQYGLHSSLSLKLTQIGLDLSADFCLDNMRMILKKAKEYGIFVQIDMEDYKRNEVTLEIFKTLHREYKGAVGTVIQAYLYKSMKDVEMLDEYQATLRICKGAYKEPEEYAFPKKKDVDHNYFKLVKTHLLNGHFVGIATHDEAMIGNVRAFIQENNIPKDQYEFQMLYGIATELQEKLLQRGETLRIYVPYGDDWFGYFMRRLAERPANVWFVMKNAK